MRCRHLLIITSCTLVSLSFANAQQVYCPQNSKYINLGMTQAEIIDACGQPLSKQTLDTPAVEKVPVKQLIYTALDPGSVYPGLNAAFYTQWSLPSGTNGINMEINIINNKVSSFAINGSSTNAVNICGGTPIQEGDSIDKVYSACGSPAMVNESFEEQMIPSKKNPEVWVYQLHQYQAPISLTFVDGKLQSIN